MYTLFNGISIAFAAFLKHGDVHIRLYIVTTLFMGRVKQRTAKMLRTAILINMNPWDFSHGKNLVTSP